MEEVINKTDGQFKNILDDLVDYNKHASQKDPIIKKLNSNPPASLNSSTYSSAASSSSSSSSSSSTSSTSSSLSSSDPTHSPTSSALNSASTSPSQNQQLKNGPSDEGEFEIARLEHLGRTAKILEHHKIRSKSSASKQSHDLTTASTADFGRLLDQLGDKVNYSQNGIIAAAQLQTIAQQKYTASSNAKSIQPESADANSTASNVSSWKTISARRDKRKKKAVEIKIFAEHIPGNRGHATIDELTKFIESGTTNGAASSSARGNKSKQQAGSSISNNTNNNSNHSNSGNGHSNNIVSTTNTKSLNNNSAPNEINPINTTNNNINKKNESHLATMKKTNMATSKMITNSNNVVQNKNPPMQKNVTNQSTTTTRNSQQRSSKQSQNEQMRESHDQKIASKVPQAPQQLPKSLSSQLPRQQPSPVQLRVDSADLNQAPKQQSTIERSKGRYPNESQDGAAVTFAHHLRVHDDDARQYTFGFFEEQSNQTQQTKATTAKINANHTILVDKNVNVIDAIKHSSPSRQSSSNQHKTISKQPKTSPNSEEKCSKSNDKIDANSFNYDQILKFISNRWVEAQKSATASKGY